MVFSGIMNRRSILIVLTEKKGREGKKPQGISQLVTFFFLFFKMKTQTRYILDGKSLYILSGNALAYSCRKKTAKLKGSAVDDEMQWKFDGLSIAPSALSDISARCLWFHGVAEPIF